MVYYFHISGPWRKPEVKHVPFKNMGKGLVGYFERIFTTPPRLMRKAGEITRYFQNFNGTSDDREADAADGPVPPRRRNDK